MDREASLNAAVCEFLDSCDADGLDQATVKDYRSTLFAFRSALDGHRRLDSITPVDMERYKISMAGSGSTRAKKVRHLKRFFSWCDQMDLAKNPAKTVRTPKFRQEPTMPFLDSDVYRMLESSDQELRAAILLLLYSGLRISDAIELRPSDIDQRGYIRIQCEKTGATIALKLHRECLESLTGLPVRAKYLRKDTESLGACYQRIWGAMGLLGDRLGIAIRPHRFRDTFACRLLSEGVDIRIVSKLLGHKSVKTTEQHYAAYVKSDLARMNQAVECLEWGARPAEAAA